MTPSTTKDAPTSRRQAREEDQRVFLRGLSWDDFETFLRIKGDQPVPRVTYLEGVLELMSPSREHELAKTMIGRLVEAFADSTGIELNGYGSWTLKRALKESGAEPDECYAIGRVATEIPPDLVIEVIWTSGGLDKLEVYRRLGVKEVWFWEDGAISLHLLGEDGYVEQQGSGFLPGIDLALVAQLALREDQSQAIREFRAALGG